MNEICPLSAIKLAIQHSWVKEIHICSNEGPMPFLRGPNSKLALGLFQPNLAQDHVKGIKVQYVQMRIIPL